MPVSRPAPSPPPMSGVSAVEATARDYIEGWYAGDVERMERALHPDLVKRTLDSDGPAGGHPLRAVSRERMLTLTAAGGGKAPGAVVRILVDEVSDGIAAARIASPEYLDYLHLVETPDGWKIANVLFRNLD